MLNGAEWSVDPCKESARISVQARSSRDNESYCDTGIQQ